jgi:hypothetical protein
MSVTIPGALADHIAYELFGDETAECLAAARRGRGRTLVIEPTSTHVLHTISRHAEYVLRLPKAFSPALRRACRLWIDRAGHAPARMVHHFSDTTTAYNHTQCRYDIADGDVLVIESEQVVGFLRSAWPAAITAEHGELHTIAGDPRTLDDGQYAAAVDDAQHLARELGFPLAETVEEQPAADETEAAADEQPVVIIPCGAAKLDRPAPAAELYTGSYHQACARAAAALTANGGTVLILSALHGLTPLDRVLAPYDMRMGAAGSVTPDLLRQQARELGLDRAADVTILAGLSYTAPALAVWPHAATPLAGLPGMGHHMSALAAIATTEEAPAATGPALYAPAGLRNLTTGHLLDDATGRAYCGAELAGPNGAAVLTCTACRHTRDAQAADVEAQEAATQAADRYIARNHPHVADLLDLAAAEDEARYAAALVTEAEATDGTWRGEWIGPRADDTLFTMDTSHAEQGALFA